MRRHSLFLRFLIALLLPVWIVSCDPTAPEDPGVSTVPVFDPEDEAWVEQSEDCFPDSPTRHRAPRVPLNHSPSGSINPHDLRSLERLIRGFSEDRDWEAFHVPKNLVMALAVEAAELMEPLQWLTPEEAGALSDDPEALEKLESEMADVAIYLIRLADVMGVDLGRAIVAKVRKNEERFPVERIRGQARLPLRPI